MNSSDLSERRCGGAQPASLRNMATCVCDCPTIAASKEHGREKERAGEVAPELGEANDDRRPFDLTRFWRQRRAHGSAPSGSLTEEKGRPHPLRNPRVLSQERRPRRQPAGRESGICGGKTTLACFIHNRFQPSRAWPTRYTGTTTTTTHFPAKEAKTTAERR